MKPRCVAGDLAVVVHAHHRTNLGRIVKVLAPHDGRGDLIFRDAGFIWLVESSQPMTWSIGKKRFRRKRGPAPDSYLKPIRGHTALDDAASTPNTRRVPADQRKTYVEAGNATAKLLTP